MRRTIHRLLTAIQLTRLTMAFGAVSDLWLVILVTKSGERPRDDVAVYDMDLVSALLLAAIVAVGLFAYGASLNDVLDARHDSAFSPERPIPAGRIRPGQAIVVTVGALLVSILAAQGMGKWSLQLTLLTAVGILFYNTAGKFIPAVGIVSIGLIHAIHMAIPNPRLTLTLPIWLIMTHAMAIAFASYVLEGKRPRIGRHTVGIIVAAWFFWSAVIIGWGVWRGPWWPGGASLTGLFWPALSIGLFVWVARWKTTGIPGPAAAEKLRRYGAMWQAIHAAAWLMALGLQAQAAWLLGFGIVGFGSMTLLKEVIGQVNRPMAFRE